MGKEQHVVKERGYWVRWTTDRGKVSNVTYGAVTNGDWNFPWHPGGVKGWANDRIREKGYEPRGQ